MRILCHAIFQRQNQEIGRLASLQSTALAGPAEGLRSPIRRHVQDYVARQIGKLLMQKTHFIENAQIRVGCEAIGTERHADAASQEFAEGMRGMIEGSVRSRAVNDAAIRRKRRVRP